jgi:hypothetical protein
MNSIRTLLNVDLVLWVVLLCGMAITMVVQMKEGLYHDRYFANMFFLLAIEVLGVSSPASQQLSSLMC